MTRDSDFAVARVLLGVALVIGCSRGPRPTRESDPPTHLPVPVSSAVDVACARDDDCAICSDGQCGAALPRRRVLSLGAECQRGGLCEPWNPTCREGRCVSLPPPAAERCVHNEDCTTCWDSSHCGQPMARARVRALGAGCAHPARSDCRQLELVCHEGRCLDPKLLEY